jgi:UTP--glucose-1-phosphate uridylyltransferase
MITKAIIPVAGIGSRFLPASKSIPKEMFPLVNKPVIHYIVQEAVEAGIKDIIFITSTTKKSLEDYFDRDFELEYRLDKKDKTGVKRAVSDMVNWANFYFIRQPEPLGDGDAILRARNILNPDEAVVVLWGDDVIIGGESSLRQLTKVYEKYHAPVFALQEISGKAIERYGVIQGDEIETDIYKISHIVEKPRLAEAPSNLAIVGKYIITPAVIKALLEQKPAQDGEIKFSHALRDTIKHTPVYGYKISGTWYDCGNKLGWLKANIALGLEDQEIGEELRLFIDQINAKIKNQNVVKNSK